MDYRKLTVDTWKELDNTGSKMTGYKTIFLSLDHRKSPLHIFQDESGIYHFAIEEQHVTKESINDPQVNGLTVSLNHFRIGQSEVVQLIDLQCNMTGYLNEFTEITIEVARRILENNERPLEVVNRVIRNWKTFWAGQNKQMLSLEEVIGLVCELKMLEKLCAINPLSALNSWAGPWGENHDFNFTDWTIEVKGTLKGRHIHTINGIDQLRPVGNKSLAFVSFFVSIADTANSITLQSLIDDIITGYLAGRPDLNVRFNELLARAGYSPFFIADYRKLKLEINEVALFKVDHNFPVFNSTQLKEPLNNRITNFRYDISLEGLPAVSLDKINLGDYFY